MKYFRIWVSRSWWSSNGCIYVRANDEIDALGEVYESYPHNLVEDCEEITEEEYETECVL